MMIGGASTAPIDEGRTPGHGTWAWDRPVAELHDRQHHRHIAPRPPTAGSGRALGHLDHLQVQDAGI
eukprot:2671709-Pyramimonas_sp.AAC.1